MSEVGAQGRGERIRPDPTMLRDLVSVMTERLVGTTVSLGREGSRLNGTVTEVDIEPVDVTMSAQVEAGLAAWSEMNDAALGSLDRIDPVGTGLRMFGAAVSGFEKMLDAGPVNPIVGVAKIARRLHVVLESARHPRWRATRVELRCADVRTSFDVGATTLRARDVSVVGVLDQADLTHSIEAMGWGAHDIRLVGPEAFVVRKVGPATLWLPLDVALTVDEVVVGVSTIRAGRWRVDLPRRLARSWRRPRAGVAGPLRLASVDVARGVLTVTATADEVQEPVTATQLSSLLGTLQSGVGDVRVDRIRSR